MKKRYLLLIVFIFLGLLFVNKTFSKLKPVEKVSFKSEALDFDKQEAGAYKVDKSAKWIGKDKALVTIEADSYAKEQKAAKDVIFVLDISYSMHGDRIKQLKKDAKEFAEELFKNPQNRAALISFDDTAEKHLDFTNNKEEFITKIDALTEKLTTNYKAGLVEAQKLLKTYQKDENKDLILLFLTDGYPNLDTPSEITTYKELKATYPYMHINAVQYEMGTVIKQEIKQISDKQYHADMNGLNNVLFTAGSNAVSYDNFIITDVISKHFKGNPKKIKASQGQAILDGDKVIWDLGEYVTGTKAKLEIELELTGEGEELYETNKGIKIEASFEKEKEEQLSSLTPVLKGSYKISYDANSPKGCVVQNLEPDTKVKPFDTVELVKGKATCEGYLFKGYKIISNVKMINEDHFEMPDNDVTLKAIWSKLSMEKSMQGTIYKRKLYDDVIGQSLGNDMNNFINYKASSSINNGEGVYLFNASSNDETPVYYFRGTHNLKNNIIYNGFCWKIVRTTETGGVRMIYNGKPDNGKCNLTSEGEISIAKSAFNLDAKHIKHAGYMYGDDANPYENTNDSKIKKEIDKWYEYNFKDKEAAKLLDKKTIYCNDRNISNKQQNYEEFGAYPRFYKGKPSLNCDTNNSFSVEDGNKKLTYPIALLTADEYLLAGASMRPNQNFYLYTKNTWWTMSPGMINNGDLYMLKISNGGIGQNPARMDFFEVRPVLTVKRDTVLLSGTGSQNDPYII